MDILDDMGVSKLSAKVFLKMNSFKLDCDAIFFWKQILLHDFLITAKLL